MRLLGDGARRHSLRINRTALLLAIAVVLAVGSVKLAQPLAAARRQQDDLALLRREKTTLQRDNAGLERYQREVATDPGQERAARREGYLRKGERRLVFTPEPSQTPAPKHSKAPKR
jgi:flagellar biosynthesis/type III secretory pathway M-ring protein FliF/YscJ